MYRRKTHRRVARILRALDARFLASCKCYFGGGTRIVLELDEYRESADVDFLCQDARGYRALRETVTQGSLGSILRSALTLAREVRADQYGIRTVIDLGDREPPVKFEIVREARVPLAGRLRPGLAVPALDHTTCMVEKLLANADRGLDRSALSRDLIDLAVMASRWPGRLRPALRRAESAYGATVQRGLSAAAALFVSDPAYAERCLRELRVTRSAVPRALIARWAN
ncbi:MAG: nucleotidyl transferase AbiEii/AbiGii toxin family protein [Burkholderiales bacterium]